MYSYILQGIEKKIESSLITIFIVRAIDIAYECCSEKPRYAKDEKVIIRRIV